MRIGIAADLGGFELKVQLISRGPNSSDAVLRKWRCWEERRSLNRGKTHFSTWHHLYSYGKERSRFNSFEKE
jgi:hypothetical protein